MTAGDYLCVLLRACVSVHVLVSSVILGQSVSEYKLRACAIVSRTRMPIRSILPAH